MMAQEINGGLKATLKLPVIANKRLMPQLALKVPIFRRWGKRFFVAVDNTFFAELPPMREQSPGKSEVTWLVYDFKRKTEGGYQMQAPSVVHTLWDDVALALREGVAPEKSDLLAELSRSAARLQRFQT